MAAQKGHTKVGGRKKGTPNKATAEIRAAFREHGEDLVKALLALTKSKDERVRLAAIQVALDRGWGRPALSMAVIGNPDSPVIFDIRLGDGLRTVNGDPVPALIDHDQAGVGTVNPTAVESDI